MRRVLIGIGALWSSLAVAGPLDGEWVLDREASVPLFDPAAVPWLQELVERWKGPPPELRVRFEETEGALKWTVKHEEHSWGHEVKLDGAVEHLPGRLGFLVDAEHWRDADGALHASIDGPLHDVELTLRAVGRDTVHLQIVIDDGAREGLRVFRRVAD
jgi:hypothetical protein